MIGVVNVNKPKGITSSDVVVKIKKTLNLKKVGHMGTLDPLATGVLPICVGKATRLFDYFLKKRKTYIAQFKFGEETDSLDLEGEVVKTSNNIPTKEDILKILKTLIGPSKQIPPMFSSKKINGKKACDLARKGVTVELKPCDIILYEYSLRNQISSNTFEFKITCSAGTYIRCLARDLANKLNSCATMISLNRVKAGPFTLENSINFEDISKENIEKSILSLEKVLIDFEKIVISQQDFQKLLNGLKLNINNKQENVDYAVVCDNQIIGIGQVNNNQLKLKTFLA